MGAPRYYSSPNVTLHSRRNSHYSSSKCDCHIGAGIMGVPTQVDCHFGARIIARKSHYPSPNVTFNCAGTPIIPTPM
eukprot:13870957-Heterocapsa_arctica.AAC.1